MKTSVLVIFVMLLSSLVAAKDSRIASSQNSKPDFSGRWILDVSVDSKGKVANATEEIVLIVKHREPEIQFLEIAGVDEQEMNYFTDGRGEENPSSISFRTGTQSDSSAQENENLKSRTKWYGDKIVARAILQRTVSGHTFRMEIVKEWKLSKDGNALTITSRRTNLNPSIHGTTSGMAFPAMTSEMKMVFRRDVVEVI